MSLLKNLLVFGLASVSPFSIAQQIVEPGNSLFPHQPPGWFVRMASPEREVFPVLDGFVIGTSERSQTKSTIRNSGIKYPCLRDTEGTGVKKWQFCDMF